MRQKVFYSLDLTVENGGGWGTERQNVSESDVLQAFRSAVQSIRDKSKTRGRNWKWCIWASTSKNHVSDNQDWRTNYRAGTEGIWHLHCIIYGTPASEISKELKGYWTEHHYAKPLYCSLKRCWSWEKVKYILIQQSKTILQTNMEPEDWQEMGYDHKPNRKEFLSFAIRAM